MPISRSCPAWSGCAGFGSKLQHGTLDVTLADGRIVGSAVTARDLPPP